MTFPCKPGLWAAVTLALLMAVSPVSAQDATQGAPVAQGEKPFPDPDRFGGKAIDEAYGAYQRGLYITALKLALAHAEKGDPAAQTLAAEIYARGLGVPRNEKEAARWYGRAAEQGVAEAQLQYGLALMEGRVIAANREKGVAYLQRSADAGNARAAFNFAQVTVTDKPGDAGERAAWPYFLTAAKAGIPDAQYAVARFYATGSGGQPRNEAEARNWLVRAARQNFDTAQMELGAWLVEGRGGARDYEAGFRWMQVAAQAGNVAAMNRLAKLYRAALGTEPDDIAAAAWYILSRRAGLRDRDLDVFLDGLTDQEQRQAIDRANRLR